MTHNQRTVSESSEMHAVCNVPTASDVSVMRDAQDASDDDMLTQEEKGSLDCILGDKYRMPWSLSAFGLEKLPQVEVSVDPQLQILCQTDCCTTCTHYHK